MKHSCCVRVAEEPLSSAVSVNQGIRCKCVMLRRASIGLAKKKTQFERQISRLD